MFTTSSDRTNTWKTIGLFLSLLLGLSGLGYFALILLQPSSIYVSLLMWCPAIAAMLSLKLTKKPISDLPWKWPEWKYMQPSYLVPVGYVAIAYGLLWGLGLGEIPDDETLLSWRQDLGLPNSSEAILIPVMVILLATVGVIKTMATTLGEEIGWRGFFIYELRKVLPFGGVALGSGLIWALWHTPIIVFYGGGNVWLQLIAFTVMILAMSVIMTYYTFKSQSLWPAVVFHAVHNVFIQKIFTPITREVDGTDLWIDEYGLMLPIVVTIVAGYYWRKAHLEKL